MADCTGSRRLGGPLAIPEHQQVALGDPRRHLATASRRCAGGPPGPQPPVIHRGPLGGPPVLRHPRPVRTLEAEEPGGHLSRAWAGARGRRRVADLANKSPRIHHVTVARWGPASKTGGDRPDRPSRRLCGPTSPGRTMHRSPSTSGRTGHRAPTGANPLIHATPSTDDPVRPAPQPVEPAAERPREPRPGDEVPERQRPGNVTPRGDGGPHPTRGPSMSSGPPRAATPSSLPHLRRRQERRIAALAEVPRPGFFVLNPAGVACHGRRTSRRPARRRPRRRSPGPAD